MKMIYQVGISKRYFRHHTVPSYDEFYEIITVNANNRKGAATIAWQSKKNEWLPLFFPKQTKKKIISLHVNDPKGKQGGLIGRLEPIKVYEY